MLLRSLMLHLRRQDWFAVFIDFLIVVVGVFIGIQVANWNATRIDGHRARSYVERIDADLGADLANYRNRMEFWRQVEAYGAQALAYAETGDHRGATPWELLLAFFQASQISEFYTTAATYNELESAGELGLISDLPLRDALAAYYTNANNPVLTERPEYRHRVRGLIPLDVQLHIWNHCWKSDASMRQSMHACPSPVGDEVAGRVVDTLVRDPELIAELRYWMSTMRVASQIGRDRMTSAEALRGAIDAVSGDPSAP
jgi:hypothetical protein